MSEIAGLGYIGVEAGDVAAWETFATSLLGLQVAERRPDGTLVFRLDALDAFAARLEQHGVAVTSGSEALAAERRVKRLISFVDPDGNRHEAFAGPLVQPQTPFVSPRSIGPFVTAEQGLGHVVIVTADLDRQQRFFCDVVGFQLSDYVDAITPRGARSFVFMHCSGRHHALALAKIPSPKKLAHLMLQTTDMDDVGLTYDLAQQLHYPIAATLGRHANDRMFSFYVNTPSGWEVEFGADPITIDDETWHVRRYDRTSVWGHDRTPR